MASATDPGHSQVPTPKPLKDTDVDINDVNNGNPVWDLELLCNPQRSQILFSTYEDMEKSEAFKMLVRNGEKITRDVVQSTGPDRSPDVPSTEEVDDRWVFHVNEWGGAYKSLDGKDLVKKFVEITPGIRRIFLAGLGSMFHGLEHMPIEAGIRQHVLVHKICENVASAAVTQE